MSFMNTVMNPNPSADLEDARKTMDALLELSNILNCNVDKNTLSTLISMTESGVNP